MKYGNRANASAIIAPTVRHPTPGAYQLADQGERNPDQQQRQDGEQPGPGHHADIPGGAEGGGGPPPISQRMK
jgi:hypothetical protein